MGVVSARRSSPGPRPAKDLVRAGALLLVAVLALGGLALLSPPSARATAAGSTEVTLMATDQLSFAPNTISVPTLSVELEVENLGTVDHWFTISDRVNQTAPADTNASATGPGSYFASNEVLVDRSLNHSTSFFVNVTFPAAGAYEFICRYHFPDMVGTFQVGVPSSSGSSATALYLYGAGGAVVVILVAVVAIVVMRRRKPTPTPPAAPK